MQNGGLFMNGDIVYREIAKSAVYWNLGFFVGAGFSMELTTDENGKTKALSWAELLKVVCDKINMTDELEEMGVSVTRIGLNFPEIMGVICKNYIEKNPEVSLEEIEEKVKEVIMNITNWMPTKEKGIQYSQYMNRIDPDWIITTNYDQVIESILDGGAYSVDSEENFISPKEKVPVYHMHGSRLNPKNIVITQNDYVKLFRPNDYRQIKLALTIKEATTVIIGYSLGDINVLSAIDWAENYYSKAETSIKQYPNSIYQVIRSEKPREPYILEGTNITVIEVEDIQIFMNKLITCIDEEVKDKDINKGQLDELMAQFREEDKASFIDNQEMSLELIKRLYEFEKKPELRVDLREFILFFNACFQEKFDEARNTPRYFKGYEACLNMLCMIIEEYEMEDIHPNLLWPTLDNLNKLLSYVGSQNGKSWSAQDSWEKLNLPDDKLRFLYDCAEYSSLNTLSIKLEEKMGVVGFK